MKDSLHAVWELTEGERSRYGTAVASLVAASCLLYLVPLVPQIVLDGALAGDDESGGPVVDLGLRLFGGAEFLRTHLWLPAIAMAGLTLLSGAFTFFRSRLSALAAEGIAKRLRDRLYDHLQHLPCSFFDHRETGDLLQRCTSDVETLRVFLSVQVVDMGRALIMLVIPVPLMLLINVPMTIASVILVPPIVAYSAVFFLRVRAAFQEKDEAEGRLTARIQESLTGIRVVKAFHRKAYEEQLLEPKNAEHRDLDFYLYHLFARFWSLSDLLCMAQKTIVVVFGILLIARGELALGAFFFFLSSVALFIWPVRMMGRLLSELGKALVAIGRIREILDFPEEPEPAVKSLPELKGEIVFRDVTFSHQDESPVLDGIDFRIEPGTVLAVLGASGSGKTTLVNLLLRFYDPDRGSILLDGHDLTGLPRKFVRSRSSVVMQEPFLFSRSLRDNIAMARQGADEEEIVRAASIASMHESIVGFDRGYETVIGERGVTLSGGQRQRVAIARALMKEPAILILDDALSAVDTKTEARILEGLRRRKGKQTTILIAHRLSTVMEADEILVLERGRLRQRGTHESLKEEPGLYRRLWEIQAEKTGETSLEPG